MIFLFGFNTAAADEGRLANQRHKDTKRSLTLEQAQLQKARDAMASTNERNKEILANSTAGDWEGEQREKAKLHFKARESRQEKYLREAKEAAAKDRKIPDSR
ncbi:hypothetical protein [Shewanella youngdeokensis]|uniref:Uncharacterized protein n=1 Tax=Shewanella youngdeokensis TaxID=2999068 RepID=A0ABZ0K0Z9_9GAMM|nr:hypothetical protein RGE70_01100 [Shewanella sp. DAU334]